MTHKRVWMLRAGSERSMKSFSDMLDRGEVELSLSGPATLTDEDSFEDIVDEIREIHPGMSPNAIESRAKNIFDALNLIASDDLIMIHKGKRVWTAISTGLSFMRPTEEGLGFPVIRIKELISHDRDELGEDMKNSLQAHVSLSLMRADDAYERAKVIRENRADPGPSLLNDMEQIGARMGAHELAEMIADILRTDDYKCQISPPGPDGGVDIYAGKGLLGIGDSLLVQVKSGRQVVSAPQVYQIFGNLTDCGAKATLIVSWSGFTAESLNVIKKNPFKIVAWDFLTIKEILETKKDNVLNKWQIKFFGTP